MGVKMKGIALLLSDVVCGNVKIKSMNDGYSHLKNKPRQRIFFIYASYKCNIYGKKKN